MRFEFNQQEKESKMARLYKQKAINEFKKGCGAPLMAENVGQLKEILNLLPDDFAIEQGFSKSVSVCIFNLHRDNPHIEFDDGVDG